MAAEERSDVPPATLPVNADGIPTDLKKWDQWLCWDWEFRKDRWTKPPLRAVGGGYAKSNDPSTWTSFDIALAAYLQRNLAGVGVALTKSDPLCFIDLDDARDPATGEITPWARGILRSFHHTYHEVSPTGTGVKIIGAGARPGDKSVKSLTASPRAKVELYDGGGAKYTTISGHRCHGSPGHIADVQAALTALYLQLFPEQDRNAEVHGGQEQGGLDDDDDRLNRARAARNGAEVSRLFDTGDLGSHGGDRSRADQALCNHLAFWFGPDPMRVDRVFRRSALMRPKWDEKHYGDGRTYGQGTVDTALAGRADFYQPQPRLHVFRGGKSGPSNGEDERDDSGGDEQSAPEAQHLSDLGNAKRLVAQHGADLRYCPTFGKWYAWNRGHWLLDETGEVYRRAKQTVQAIYAEASNAAGDDERKALAKHALRSEGEARIRAMVGLAESEPDIPVLPPELDRDPWLLNVENGTIDLRTGKLRPHWRDDLLTRSVSITYDDLAECPTWLAFLDRVLSGKQELIAFVQRAIGYSLTGRTGERLLFILWGMGRNGKSTLLETILELLGGYASRTSTDTLLATRDGAIPNDVARLRGMRFVFASEAEEGRRLAEAKIKDLTGGDTISARFMRGEWFDFRPEFKLFLATNHKPVIRGTDNAVWDRVRLIPFNVRIPDEELDPDLRDKLLAEAPGILTWAVEGCLAWQKHGLKAPEDVRAATNAYREEMDVLGHFLDECCVIEATARATAKELYAAYQAWCGDAGEKPISQKAFGQRLAERGLDSAQFGKSRARYWIGVGLLDHHEPQRGANASGGVNA